jgi:poly(A) polymerase
VTSSPRLPDVEWLRRPPLSTLLAVLDRDGEEARVVGGAVRNSLLAEPIGDVDIATTAVPEEVVRRAKAAGFKPVPTGIEHGTITVVIGGHPFEVTTLRQDVETYGRRAKVAFGRDWAADARRRDFTINALSASPDGMIHDYVGGLADIAARRVRFIGDAAARIAEDYLRILRFFRFHASYGQGPPDPVGLHACIISRNGLQTLSRERVRMELLKLLLAPNAAPALSVMSDTGLLGQVLGGVPLVASFSNMVKLEAATGIEPDWIRRLGALGVLAVEDADRLWERLRLTNAEHARLSTIANGWWRMKPQAGEHAARAALYRLGLESFVDQVLLAWSRSPISAADEEWRSLAALPRHWNVPESPFRAADFIARGIPKGPQLGAALRAAEAAWIAADFPADGRTIARIAEQAFVTSAGAAAPSGANKQSRSNK